ncbi:hypothetical protein LSH36_278g03018 [Paralvinella palmiformis]|uniref:SAMD1-like winged helix (WH) domain-containing protein n=1 Tax=Paralvinella palmiformis TaxID=53620 RepID=A0AAD9JIY3_9ANNE|nr:hypothetical protein LSH36_278g03018 [Paralvinella palmiformis]
MVCPVRRRKALPSTVINLCTGIRYIRQQKQIPNIERISRYMQREHSVSPTETDLEGEKEEFERDGHDWYCFDCHQPGEVILCARLSSDVY